jgi:hypothetical protein
MCQSDISAGMSASPTLTVRWIGGQSTQRSQGIYKFLSVLGGLAVKCQAESASTMSRETTRFRQNEKSGACPAEPRMVQ